MQELIQKRDFLTLCIRHGSSETENAAQKLLEHPGYQELLSPYFRPVSQELVEWKSASFQSNPYKTEQLSIRASSGSMVRSKSEAMIDMALHTHKIPFRYECILILGDSVFYPDFTIRHPLTGELFYWEHFGLMDDPEYRQNAGKKMNQYISHGLIPGIHLITTYETAERPLGPAEIEEIISKYFL